MVPIDALRCVFTSAGFRDDKRNFFERQSRLPNDLDYIAEKLYGDHGFKLTQEEIKGLLARLRAYHEIEYDSSWINYLGETHHYPYVRVAPIS